MSYRYLKVNPQLTDFIRSVLVLDDAPEINRNKLPLFTNGTPVLLCRIEKTSGGMESVLQLTLYGNSAPTPQWEILKNETLIAYFFKPFAMACLFNLPAKELVKAPLELSNWNAHKTIALKTQLAYSGNNLEKIAALDNLLLLQFDLQKKECDIVRQTTDRIMINPNPEVLTEILDDLELNERTFQRIFKKFVGITPTHYRRICQFKASFDQLKNERYDKLTDVAYDTGFTDQSHFIRAFKEHTQTTPGNYIKSGLKKK